ncbi:NAD(P)/FAD-dependent oxidoreductase [Bradyrhizobium sp. Leo170]|uniref:NAD(P)/FAD-dependent oxidoreductase n=2 Tax=unclassified Bradyrhizobium TaxID=2631580 RepID=UPI0013EEC143|nr:NAD(P)/FAD-dependent oxidoreductase [Bradyrhizobium sp. Leo170]
MKIDVVIVGGGPAGLSAALILGRCHRQVLLCDDEQPRNRASHAIHGLLGREGRSPSAFLGEARQELTRYKSVSIRWTRVNDITPADEGFEFTCADGTTGIASKVLLATGIVDELPEIAGVEALYGVSVHHCLYCDGFEYAGKPVAAFGKGDEGADLAVMMKHWMADVVACSDGTEISADAARKLKQHGIPLRNEPIASVEGAEGVLTKIRFKSGPDLDRAALFFSTGCHQASDLSELLGCKRDRKGGVVTDSATEETSVPGVYVAGDVSRDVLLVAAAIAEGAKAAVAINKAFLLRDGFCE